MDRVMNIGLDVTEEVGKEFVAFCNERGHYAETVLRLFMHAVVRDKKIPREVVEEVDLMSDDEDTVRLRKSIEAYEAGNNNYVVRDLVEIDD